MRFSHAGIKAELVAAPEPAKKDANAKGMGRGGSRVSTEAKFKVTVAKDVPVGTHDVRVVGKFGVSNPRAFVVGTLPEIVEVEPNSDVPQAQKIELNTVVHGVIEAITDVDYFTFTGKKGQRILAHCAASSIDSRARPFVELYAADGRTRIGLNSNDRGNDALCDVTLPADGEYYLRITEFAYTAGGSEYFYRLTLTTGPWLDAIFPPMIEPGKTANVMLIGRGLPSGKPAGLIDGKPLDMATALITAPNLPLTFTGPMTLPQASGLLDGFAVSPNGLNARPIFYATAPVILETPGDKSTPEKAQAVAVPCEIAGRIDVKFDRDCYRFDAKKGEPLMIELFAERIGTTMDGVLSLKDAKGREIAGEQTLDDDPEALHPTSFFNRTTDPPPYRFMPPADGSYTIQVSARDANVNFGPRSIYRLRIAPPKPDFRVLAMPRNRDFPSGITVTSGSETAIDVFVQRLDGFNGEVTATVSGLPASVTAKPAMIGTGQKWGLILLTGAADLKSAEADVKVTATAMVEGKAISRLARSGSITWPVPGNPGSPTIARLDNGLVIATRSGEKLPYRLVAKLDKATIKTLDGKEIPAKLPLAVKAGERIIVPVGVEWLGEGSRTNSVNIGIEPTMAPPGGQNPLTVNGGQSVVVPKEKAEATVSIDVRQGAPPGYYTVNLRGDGKVNMISDAATKAKKEYTLLAFAAPFPVTVVPTSLGRFTVLQTPPIKPGQSGTLIVRVERQFEFAGEYKVKLTFPEKSGLSAKEGVIKSNANEVQIQVAVAGDAKPGTVRDVIVQTVAAFDANHSVTSETKTNITISK